MKMTLNRLVLGFVLVVGSLYSGMASAETVIGKIWFLGTLSEESAGGFHARFRMGIAESTCGGDVTPTNRWIHVRSGRMDGEFAHNSANLRNAYGTLLVAFVTGKRVQIDGVQSCDASAPQTIDLWVSSIGVL